MKASKLLMGIPTLLCAMLFASSAFAGDVTVDNPSFEIIPGGGLPLGCGTDCSYSIDAIPGWINSGYSGQFQPGPPATTTYFDSVPNGPTVAYTNVSGGTISQTVGATVQDGLTYTLTVDIGARKDFPFDGSADLMLGGTMCTATGTPPSPGGWSLYTATCVGTSGEAGDPITIQLNSSGEQGDFDAVALTDSSVSPIPEPSTLTLFGSGLLAMAYLFRRKRFAQS